jgi:hypothetical protein
MDAMSKELGKSSCPNVRPDPGNMTPATFPNVRTDPGNITPATLNLTPATREMYRSWSQFGKEFPSTARRTPLGKTVWRRKLVRRDWIKELPERTEPSCEIGMEATTDGQFFTNLHSCVSALAVSFARHQIQLLIEVELAWDGRRIVALSV